jgi:hypothetical protein
MPDTAKDRLIAHLATLRAQKQRLQEATRADLDRITAQIDQTQAAIQAWSPEVDVVIAGMFDAGISFTPPASR